MHHSEQIITTSAEVTPNGGISLDDFCRKHISETMGIKQQTQNANPSQDIWPYSVRDYQPLWSLETLDKGLIFLEGGVACIGWVPVDSPWCTRGDLYPTICDKKVCALPFGKSWRCCLVLLLTMVNHAWCIHFGENISYFKASEMKQQIQVQRWWNVMYQHNLVNDGPYIIELKLVLDLPFLNLGPTGFFLPKCIASWQSSQVVFAGRGICI